MKKVCNTSIKGDTPVGFGTNKWPSFAYLASISLEPRVWLCLLDFGHIALG